MPHPHPADEPRWLTAEEQQAWRAYLRMTLLLHEQLDRQLQRDAGMPHAHYQILAMLSEAPGRSLRMSELARITRFSPSRLSHAVARLERDGLVHRRRCAEDRRGWHADLTDAGLARVVEVAPGHAAAVRHHLFDRLTPAQVRQLTAIAEASLATLAPDGGPQAAG